MDIGETIARSLTLAIFYFLIHCISDVQKKAKQIYETQKKKEEMTEAESEELAVRRRKIFPISFHVLFSGLLNSMYRRFL